MAYDPQRYHRRSIRKKGHDYSTPGAYYVTICAKRRERIVKASLQLTHFASLELTHPDH